MISPADFPQIFPWMVELHTLNSANQIRTMNIEPVSQVTASNQANYDPCLARWEDDGGMTFNKKPPRSNHYMLVNG